MHIAIIGPQPAEDYVTAPQPNAPMIGLIGDIDNLTDFVRSISVRMRGQIDDVIAAIGT